MSNATTQSPRVLENKLKAATGAAAIGKGESNVSAEIDRAIAQATKYGANQSLPSAPSRAKLIWRQSTDRYYVITSKIGAAGYVLVILERGIVTTSSSEGGNSQLLRVVQVIDLLDAWGGKHAYSSVSGTWTESSYNYPNAAATFGKGDAGAWWANSGAAGSYLEYTFTVTESGEYNIKFFTSNGSTNDVDISLNGVVVDTISLQNSAGGLYTYTGKTNAGAKTLRITNKTTSSCLVFGVNYYSIRQHPSDRTPEAFVYFRTDTPYITNQGASDYAVYSKDDDKWAGSFHGGETLISERFIIDNAVRTLAADQLVIFSELSIEQSTRIDWLASGNSFDVASVHNFASDAGYTFYANFSGSANVEKFYTCMSTTESSFIDVKFPINLRLSGAGGDYELARNDLVCQRDPTSNNSLWNKFTLFNNDQENLRTNGAYILEAVGTYNKLYYGPIVDNPNGVLITEIAFSAQKVFN